MYQGANRDEWTRLSVLMALMANLNRDPKQRAEPFTPADFSIYDSRGRLKKPRKQIPIPFGQMLKGMGLKKRKDSQDGPDPQSNEAD